MKKDVYDLASVMGAVVNEQADKLDFKDILHLQKMVNYFASSIQDFSDAISKIAEEKNGYVKIANAKIAEFKKKLQKEAEKKGMEESYKTKLDEFVNMVLENTQNDVNEFIAPQYENLYVSTGNDLVDLELEEEKHKLLLDKFALFAKEKYTNKNRMLVVYEALTS